MANISCPRISNTVQQSLFRPPPSAAFNARCQFRQQIRLASANAQKYKRDDDTKSKKKKKGRAAYLTPSLKHAEQFALCDAMRYIRAFEVGRSPTSIKYEMAVRLRTMKNGPVVRSRFRLPHAVDTEMRVCVICPPDSKAAKDAKEAGAVLVGEDDVLDQIKEGKIDFERCICHVDSAQKLAKSGVGRILGPRGLMPSAKTGTVVKDVAAAFQDVSGGTDYRERNGVVRLAIGQLGFTPDQLQTNIRTFMTLLKADCAKLSEDIAKDIHEVVLSSTNGPGFSLNGKYKSPDSVSVDDLSTPLQ